MKGDPSKDCAIAKALSDSASAADIAPQKDLLFSFCVNIILKVSSNSKSLLKLRFYSVRVRLFQHLEGLVARTNHQDHCPRGLHSLSM